MCGVTSILTRIASGDPSAADQLLPLVYQELRKLAAAKLAHEKPGQTLQATALVHEAYLRLVNVNQVQNWDSRGHFFSAAAEAIRRILIERARRKAGPKAGGSHRRIELTEFSGVVEAADWDLLDLNAALDRLEAVDMRAAQVAKLRFFSGLTRQEAAQALGISIATADNDWAYAKGWLQVQLASVNEPDAFSDNIRQKT